MSRTSCAAMVFDLDGTLVDTEPYYRAAFHAAAQMFGMTVPPDLYRRLVGIATRERGPLLRDAFGAAFPVDEFIAAYYAQRAVHLPARLPLCDGAGRLLRRLLLPKAIATSASRRTALSHIDRAGLGGHFVHVLSRDDVPRGKPAPDTFLGAAARLAVAPADCLAVEDSTPGVVAACRAGMRVVLVDPQAPPEIRSMCLATLPTLNALPKLLPPGVLLPEPCSLLPRSNRDEAEEELMTQTP